MFGRRNPVNWLAQARHALWPRRGWRRHGSYMAHRLKRLPGSPTRIAAGFACGVAVSFTPFLGLHFVLAALLAALMRGNLIASALGTAVGNPWTFPFIWAWIYAFGQWLIGGDFRWSLPGGFSMSYIFDNPEKILLPMVLGGVPTAIMAWFATFWPLRSAVDRYQKARRRRIRRKMRRERDATKDYLEAEATEEGQ